MNSMQPSQPDPSMQSDSDTGGYTIEIEVDSDGSISVSCESDQQEGDETQGGPDDDSSSTPAKDINDALSIAKQIYASNGKMPSGQDDGMKDAQSGYDSQAAKRIMGGGPTNAVFGE